VRNSENESNSVGDLYLYPKTDFANDRGEPWLPQPFLILFLYMFENYIYIIVLNLKLYSYLYIIINLI